MGALSTGAESLSAHNPQGGNAERCRLLWLCALCSALFFFIVVAVLYGNKLVQQMRKGDEHDTRPNEEAT